MVHHERSFRFQALGRERLEEMRLGGWVFEVFGWAGVGLYLQIATWQTVMALYGLVYIFNGDMLKDCKLT